MYFEPSECTIRPGCVEDLDSVAAICADAFSEPWPQHGLLQYLKGDSNEKTSIVATVGGRVVAFVFMDATAPHLYIPYTAVAPQWQRLGIATRLMTWVLEHLSQFQCASASLHCCASEDAPQKTYRRVGFREVRRLPELYGRFGDGLEMAFPA